jgi:hypothetical protein
MKNERDVEFTPGPGMSNVGGTGQGASSSGGGTFDSLGGEAASRAGDARDKAEELGARALDTARDMGERAAEEVQSRVEDQKYRAADSLGNFAQSLRTASNQMPADDGVSRYMARAAEQVDNLASFLNNRDVADLVDEVEVFARRQPAAFVGSAFALGLLSARFLKSSRRNLVDEGVREGWSTREMTARMPDPTRDAVARPHAPGYAPPSVRGDTEIRAPGER